MPDINLYFSLSSQERKREGHDRKRERVGHWALGHGKKGGVKWAPYPVCTTRATLLLQKKRVVRGYWVYDLNNQSEFVIQVT